MLGLDLKDDLDEIRDEIGIFSADEQRRATAQALNDAARGARTDASKKIRERYPALKKSEVDASFSIKFAKADDLQAVVTIRGRPFTVTRFVTSVVTTKGQGGVWVDIKGDRKFFPHAWVQTLKSSKGGEFKVVMGRANGAGRLPVEVFHTIDVPGAFALQPVYEYVSAQSDVRFEKRLSAAFNRIEGSR